MKQPVPPPTGSDINALLEAALAAYRLLEVLAPEDDATDALKDAINRVLFYTPDPLQKPA